MEGEQTHAQSTLECEQALAAYRTQKAADILLHGLMCGDFPLLFV